MHGGRAVHRAACRAVRFSPDGRGLYTASSDHKVLGISVDNSAVAWTGKHEAAVNALLVGTSDIVFSGDDDGCVKMWDMRLKGDAVLSFTENEDFISDLWYQEDKKQLVCPSGDGTVAVYDIRKGNLFAMSDPIEDEHMSVVVLKHGRKCVTGTQGGVLNIFSWGDWGDMKDRYPGHPNSIDTIVKIDEDTIFTGSADGIIRVVQLQPNKLLGVIGDHEGFPVERIALSHDKSFLASCSHDSTVKFWDVGYIFEEDDGEDDDEADSDDSDDSDAMDDGERAAAARRKAKGKQKVQQPSTNPFFGDL